MGRKRHPPEQIITALREAEVGLARGKSVKLISRAPASREERCDCGGAREAHGAHARLHRAGALVGRWKCEPLAGGKLRRPRA